MCPNLCGNLRVAVVPEQRYGEIPLQPPSEYDRQHTELAGTTARHLAASPGMKGQSLASGDMHGMILDDVGNRRSIACSVNRFVNRTLRDSTRRGRRSRRSGMGYVLSAEVTAPARDGLRRQRPMSYGS